MRTPRDKMLLGQPAQMVKFGPLGCGDESFDFKTRIGSFKQAGCN